MTAVQPGVRSDIDRYQGIGEQHPDLFKVELGPSPMSDRPEIYGAFGASPELSY